MIAPEGRKITIIMVAGVVVLHLLLGFYVWPLWGVVLAFAWLYRDQQSLEL